MSQGMTIPDPKHILELDGVRGIAVTCIALAAFLGGSTVPNTKPMMTLGSLGIDLAFFSAVGLSATKSGSSSIAARVLRSPFFTKCGKYSYAMYVFQTPLRYILLIHPIRLRIESLGGSWAPSLLSVAFGIATSYVLAVASWKWLESPFLQLKSRFVA